METLYEEITGQPLTKFYRPPQGKYSQSNLKMLGTGIPDFFLESCLVDWYEDDQPSKEEAFDKLLSRIHPGAIVLLHSTSSTNAQILDELRPAGKRWAILLDRWRILHKGSGRHTTAAFYR